MATILFFGRLRDAAGQSRRTVRLQQAVSLAAFRNLAVEGDAALEQALCAPSVRVAVNAVLVTDIGACMVSPDDEVAFMPPFSGG